MSGRDTGRGRQRGGRGGRGSNRGRGRGGGRNQSNDGRGRKVQNNNSNNNNTGSRGGRGDGGRGRGNTRAGGNRITNNRTSTKSQQQSAAPRLSQPAAVIAQKPQTPKLKNGEKGADVHTVSEEYRINLTRILMELREDDTKEMLEFPSTLTNTERKFVHELSSQLGLKSKSTGKGDNRKITVRKQMDGGLKQKESDDIPLLKIGRKGEQALKRHIEKFPPTREEELESYETGSSLREAFAQDDNDAVASRLNQMGLMNIKESIEQSIRPDKYVNIERRKHLHIQAQQMKRKRKEYRKMIRIRKNLPAYEHEQNIVNVVAENSVTIISGETGCGKSTQVPQFIFDANPTCCIAVTQPRRISAISIAERVAEEQCQYDNDNSINNLIGFHVRLESSVTTDTQLVFMTPGILLRKMQSSPHLNEYTHIIIDEVHERDKYQEFLLIVLRDLLPNRPDLRLILMSATLQTMTLVDYFSSHNIQPAIVEMKGRMFPVQEFFLEDVLQMTNYIEDFTSGSDGCGARLESELAKAVGQTNGGQAKDVTMECIMCGKTGFANATELGVHIALCDGTLDDDEESNNEAESASIVKVGSSDISDAPPCQQMQDLSQFEDYDVNGKLEYNDLLEYNAHSKSTSLAPNRLEDESSSDGEGNKWDGSSPFEAIKKANDGRPKTTEDELLERYQAMHDDETIDNFLLLEVLQYIVKSSYGDGGILIFLPGWQEISELTILIESSTPFRDRSKYLILPLHSGIPSKDQRRVLQRPPNGVRKIVISTNLAETSLTIEDIAFVVDSGRAKEKNYDPHLKTSTLQPTWISQASAKQRKGRAGRVKAGVCFRLFSRRRHDSMQSFTESELLRTPLEEMCLMCKQLQLAPGGPEDDDGIPAFLSKAMSAPHIKSVTNALELLVDLGAMQPETNNLTILGECLAVLSLEPRVGKMVLWSYLLGCSRVAANMAVAMSYKSPFILPHESQRRAADAAKLQLSQNSESDQITIHYILDMLEQCRNRADFCRRHFVGLTTIQMIADLRKNLTKELASMGFPNPSVKAANNNRHDKNQALWQAAVSAGLYPNVAFRQEGEVNFKTTTHQKLKIHISSVNALRGQPLSNKCKVSKGDLEFVCFGEMVKGMRLFTANQTTHLVSPLPLLIFCGTSLTVRPIKDSNFSLLKLDNWISFKCSKDLASQIIIMRKRMDSAFWHFLSSPSAGVNILNEKERDAIEVGGTVIQSAHSTASR